MSYVVESPDMSVSEASLKKKKVLNGWLNMKPPISTFSPAVRFRLYG